MVLIRRESLVAGPVPSREPTSVPSQTADQYPRVVPEPRRTRANGRASRQNILDVALEVFAQRGHRGTTLREVAQRAGMTQPGLLHHFATKDELLLEVVRNREEATAPDVARHIGDGTLDLQGAIQALADVKEREPVEQLLLTTLSAEAVPADHPLHGHFVDLYETKRRQLTEALCRGQAEGTIRAELDVVALAREIIATLDGLRLQWLLDPERVPLPIVLTAYARRISAEISPAPSTA